MEQFVFLEIEKQLLGTKVELLKEFFTKQFIVEFCA
jgi:hypothetical protein